MLSKHRATDLSVVDYWNWQGKINNQLTEDRSGFEASRSTDIYIIEHGAGNNCYRRSKPRFNGLYEHDHVFVECTRAVNRTLEAGGFRGFSENHLFKKVLSVGRPIKARGFDGTFADLVLLTEVDQTEVLELVAPQENRLRIISYFLAGIIITATMLLCSFLHIAEKKRRIAEDERDAALDKLRMAVDVSFDDIDI